MSHRQGVMPCRTISRRFARLLAPEQEGSILMLTAAMMVVLMGIVGLAVDVGHQMTEYRQAQNAADAAALAGAYALYAGGDETAATTKADLLLQRNGFPVSSVTLSYLDASDQPTSVPSAVYHVKADVRITFPTYFIRVLGMGSRSVGTSATAQVQHIPMCELCVLNKSSKAALNVSGGGSIVATNIRVIDNSNNIDALDDSGGGSIVDTGPDAQVAVVGGVYGGGTLQPPATTGIQPIADPLAYLLTPNASDVPSQGGPITFSLHGNSSQSIDPGVYDKIDDTSSGTLTLNPGIYVITNHLTVNGAGYAVVGNGVMLYFACPSSTAPYFTACAPGQSGGQLNLNGNGPLTLSAMTPSYADAHYPPPANTTGFGGVLIYYDRNNISTLGIQGNGSSNPLVPSITGTIYAKSSLVTIAGNGNQATGLDSFIVADQAKFTGSIGGGPGGGLDMTFQQGLNAPFSLLDGLVQ